MPLPCPYDLAALARFLTTPEELEAFVGWCAEHGGDIRDAVHDLLVIAMDEDAKRTINAVAREIIAEGVGT